MFTFQSTPESAPVVLYLGQNDNIRSYVNFPRETRITCVSHLLHISRPAEHGTDVPQLGTLISTIP